jgi:hypothetical protein
MTPTRRNELIRIATKGLCPNEFWLKMLSEKKQVKILWLLQCWEDEQEVIKEYKIKDQQINLLR